MSSKPTGNLGVTLIELIVTISIAAILMGIAIPSFTSTIRSNQLTTYANELVASFNLARSEAIKRGVRVSVRRKGSASRNWDSGWDIFTDLNGNGTLDTEDTLLKTYPALTSGFTLRTGANFADFVVYLPTGLLIHISDTFISDTLRLCDSSANTTNSRAITINAVGRPRASEGTTACP
ncbi:GspH/FimT family pseudopilin [Methylobacter marinus]|jgi:type IV fimbrial biogenesis protein FimT|uniref:GspH/FimT family pseudopilin n=1 Tax=Methylobacter marinus TaxID=34058 RepID=UPI000365A9C6|nr:GspH/FimT family pseudopilin [Methylobacter marinus]